MEELRNNLHLLNLAKTLVKLKDTTYYEHCYINEKEITKNTVTIVMTAHERSKQVYFTLSTISKCLFKDIQIIIVDDSVNDIINIEELSKFNIHTAKCKKNKHNNKKNHHDEDGDGKQHNDASSSETIMSSTLLVSILIAFIVIIF